MASKKSGVWFLCFLMMGTFILSMAQNANTLSDNEINDIAQELLKGYMEELEESEDESPINPENDFDNEEAPRAWWSFLKWIPKAVMSAVKAVAKAGPFIKKALVYVKNKVVSLASKISNKYLTKEAIKSGIKNVVKEGVETLIVDEVGGRVTDAVNNLVSGKDDSSYEDDDDNDGFSSGGSTSSGSSNKDMNIFDFYDNNEMSHFEEDIFLIQFMQLFYLLYKFKMAFKKAKTWFLCYLMVSSIVFSMAEEESYILTDQEIEALARESIKNYQNEVEELIKVAPEDPDNDIDDPEKPRAFFLLALLPKAVMMLVGFVVKAAPLVIKAVALVKAKVAACAAAAAIAAKAKAAAIAAATAAKFATPAAIKATVTAGAAKLAKFAVETAVVEGIGYGIEKAVEYVSSDDNDEGKPVVDQESPTKETVSSNIFDYYDNNELCECVSNRLCKCCVEPGKGYKKACLEIRLQNLWDSNSILNIGAFYAGKNIVTRRLSANFSLDDLTQDEIVRLEEEILKIYLAQKEENRTIVENQNKEKDNVVDSSEDHPTDSLASFTETMAKMMEKAFDSDVMKDIIRKRIAESNFTELFSQDDSSHEFGENKMDSGNNKRQQEVRTSSEKKDEL
ncbi:hypothetical protein AAG570_011660 [Ranatra chinensis]|uniref:Uncharacterized protein n=1 Tax=Ranatra chinensis TaxID=642074 RepID=A0ABD0YGM8_9HEMI